MYDLFGNPVDRFSNDMAQVIIALPIRNLLFTWPRAFETVSCSTHLSVRFILVINARGLIIVVI